jgi:hypothetical protein
LLVGYLHDINILGTRLFASEGANAAEVLQELHRIRSALSRLEQKYDIEVIDNHNESLKEKELELHSMRDKRSIALVNIIDTVKSTEKTFNFQLKLHQEKSLLAMKTGVTDSTFTYGTTSFNCFALLMDHHAIADLDTIKAPTIGILGSSQGLLAFYSSYFFPNAKCIRGIEIMPCLHDIAQSLRTEEYFNVFDNIAFTLQDMLNCSFAGYDLIILTSLCWDKETRRKVAHKLSTELDRHCVVVDYRADTFAEFGLDQDNSYYAVSSDSKRADRIISTCDVAVLREILHQVLLDTNDSKRREESQRKKQFKLVGLVEGDVSWTSNQRLYIYVTVA